MTDDKIALRGLLEKSSDNDASVLREMIGFGAKRLRALEAGPVRRRSGRASRGSAQPAQRLS